MTNNAEFGSQLIMNARKKGDRASVNALFEYYRKSFETAAMVHFKSVPFDREVSWLPNSNRHKQAVVFSVAYDGFDEAYRTYDPSFGTHFETWLSIKIWSCFKKELENRSKRNQRELRYGEESEISEGGSVKYQNEKYKRRSDVGDSRYGARSIHNACDTDLVNEVLKSMPKSAQEKAEKLYQIFSEEGADKQCSAADRLGISRQAINKSFKSYREYGPKAIREKVLETLREKASQRVVGTKTTNCNVFKDGSK